MDRQFPSLSNSATPYLSGSLTQYPNTVAFLSHSAECTASLSKAESPFPWNMLSPKTRHTESFPINFSPMIKACAKPSGDGCSAYSKRTPKSLPSPNNR